MTQGAHEHLAGVREGQILAGKYRVERVLGVGGMGAVVAAYHVQLETKVALKFLLPGMLDNHEAVTRFTREARAVVKITNEHVARVLDVGTLENGAPYIVMEYLDGTDLAGWLLQRGPLPIEEAIDFVLQAGEALAEAHALGIVHRDLKPANLFCIRGADGRPTIKVLDFGISKMAGASGSASNMGLTRTSALMGSPFYMSPEQMEATRAVDARTDIWALGVILHELLTGRVPFLGETITEVAIKIGTREPPPLRADRPDAPEGLEAIILRCLAKDRERRYRGVPDLAVALLPFAPKRARASVEKIAAIMKVSGMSTLTLSAETPLATAGQPPPSETMAPFGRTATSPKRSKVTFGVVAGVGILALIGGLMALRALGQGSRAGEAARASDASPIVPSASTIDGAPGKDPASAAGGGADEPLLATASSGSAHAVTAEAARSGDTPAASVGVPGATARASSSHSLPPASEPPLRFPAKHTISATTASAAPGNDPAAALGTAAAADAATPPRAAQPPKLDCDPPFTLDNNGQKHFKLECYR